MKDSGLFLVLLLVVLGLSSMNRKEEDMISMSVKYYDANMNLISSGTTSTLIDRVILLIKGFFSQLYAITHGGTCISYDVPIYDDAIPSVLKQCNMNYNYHVGDKFYYGRGLTTTCENIDFTYAWRAYCDDGPNVGHCYPNSDCSWETIGRFQFSGKYANRIFNFYPTEYCPALIAISWTYDWCDGTTKEQYFTVVNIQEAVTTSTTTTPTNLCSPEGISRCTGTYTREECRYDGNTYLSWIPISSCTAPYTCVQQGDYAVCQATNMPDLIIEDIYTIEENPSLIKYKVKNQGTLSTSGLFKNILYIDNIEKGLQGILMQVSPGNNVIGDFSGWTCTGISDTIKICADINNTQTESDETNNCRVETFTCPVPSTCDVVTQMCTDVCIQEKGGIEATCAKDEASCPPGFSFSGYYGCDEHPPCDVCCCKIPLIKCPDGSTPVTVNGVPNVCVIQMEVTAKNLNPVNIDVTMVDWLPVEFQSAMSGKGSMGLAPGVSGTWFSSNISAPNLKSKPQPVVFWVKVKGYTAYETIYNDSSISLNVI